MAIARMTHIRLLGLKRQEMQIVDILTERGVFEVRRTDDIAPELQRGGPEFCRELMLKQSKISFALDFIAQRHAAMSEMLTASQKQAKRQGRDVPELTFPLSDKKFSSSRMLITHADFSDVRAKEYDLLSVCGDLQELSFKIVDCRTDINNINNTIKKYEPYKALPIKLSDLDRSGDVRISAYVGSVAAPVDKLAELNCAYDVRADDGLTVVIYRAQNRGEVEKLMNEAGLTRCPFTDDCTAEQKISSLIAERNDIERNVYELTKRALDYEKHYDELRILYDVVGLEIERARADEQFLKSDSTFLLEGWIPEAVVQSVVDEIKSACGDVFIQLLEPEERDMPPTLVVSKKLVAPYEDITNMYSAPKYREIDPNPIMSIFFFIFFGLMVGDAAYGAILAVVGLTLGFSKKLDVGTRRLLQLVGWGGLAGVVWGVLFGSYFGIDFGDKQVALWFNPIEEPMTMLYLSIALGIIQLTVGYVLMFIKLCKAGKPFSAIFDAGSIILLFGAVICLALNMLVDNAPKGLTTAAIVLAATGIALIIIFGGRNNKNVVGKVFGGFKGIYGLVNLLSDLLSYCRLFGLALSSCAIALAFNTLGMTMGAFGIPVLIVLHIFNMALAVLSAYVHNARLQVLEFYGKFYEGDGRLFDPLGSHTKHIRYA
ncbi:MAG: V-type ATP synthase subunit I [Clostridiales bacterium]|nr:V-type ATP synthase subunit I [Clostridiales bacterium]